MELKRISERVWYYPHEDERDRPILGYIKGDRFSVAVDAGHSKDHTAEFYEALKAEGLPLPELTVITHWHWDHTLGMHAINGLSIANERTNEYILKLKEKIESEGKEPFLSSNYSIRLEYEDGKPVIVTPADIIYKTEMVIDAGNCHIRAFEATAPHTDDSTLVEVIEDKVLFLGDATCPEYPNGNRDMDKTRKLADTIRYTGADTCLEGHWVPLSTKEEIHDLLEGEG